jgi:mono/diheme cytochrome c family protein
VLAVWLFVALWVVVAFVIFFIAARGGLGGARAALQSQRPRARRAATLLFLVAFVAFGVAAPVGFLVGNHANAESKVAGVKLTRAEKRGQQVFAQNCGLCHTLAAANTVGKVGPNLDMLKPSYTIVLHTIQYGCLQSPPSSNSPQNCLGQGVMPAGIIQGRDAQDVADFVSKVAGTQ